MITGLSYYDLPKYDQGYTLTQGIFCFDQQKWNLFGLVEPRIDTEGIGAVLGNPIAEGIHTKMATELRAALRLEPIQFLDHWSKMSWIMDGSWPINYQAVMRHRVQQVQRRIIGVDGCTNVIPVNFSRRVA